MFIIGASLLALVIAARRLGVGVSSDGPPELWLALMFVVGAALVVVVGIDRLVALLRKR
ncbi:Uncharacterised protein [Arthrobacter agilis]|nr:Uncharacterised protein [Arthrobacter agilis]